MMDLHILSLRCLKTLGHVLSRSRRLGIISQCYYSTNLQGISYQSKYTSDEESKIFKFLNESKPEDLMGLSMSKERIKRLIMQRSSKGDFNTFSDILSIDGLGVKLMEKFCDSILNYSQVDQTCATTIKKKPKGTIIEPALTLERSDSIKSATAILYHYNCVGWARVDRENYEVTDWEIINLENESNRKLKLHDIIEQVWKVYNALPRSDIYVMEAESTVLRSAGADKNNPKMVHINLQKAQFVAMLAAVINGIGNIDSIEKETIEHCSIPHSVEFQHKVYYLRSSLVSRLFKILVGNERVSAQVVIDSMLYGGKDSDSFFKTDNVVNMSPIVQTSYENSEDVKKELLSQTLLIIMTFYELCVFANPKSLYKIKTIG